MWKAPARHGQHLEEPNDYRVLRIVREAKSISRTEIAQISRLSKPTVSDIVQRFLQAGFLEIAGESTSTTRGGRRRELLRFNPTAGCVVAVDVRMTESQVAVTDLNADILRRDRFRYAIGSSPDAVLKGIVRKVDSMFAAMPALLEKCVGVGVGLPGLINRASGVVLVADTLTGWEGVRIRDRLQDRFGMPVHVENDVKARTLAEYLFGAGKKRLTQVFLWIGDGIGAGIIIDGKLHRGITESAGEIGYNELRCEAASKELFPIMYKGQRDFGDILSDAVIVERYVAHSRKRENVSVRTIFEHAEQGDSTARRILEEVALLTSIVCIDFINTLNPELIIIGGKIIEAGSAVLDLVQKRVRDDILHAPAEAVRVVGSALGEDGVILGAAGLVLHDLFEPTRDSALSPHDQGGVVAA